MSPPLHPESIGIAPKTSGEPLGVQAPTPPDLSQRPLQLVVERTMPSPPDVLYLAWTEQMDRWFAVPGTAFVRPRVNEPFYWETEFEGKRRPHYGRFLNLEHDRLVELTWVTGAGGTNGAETVLTVELTPKGSGTQLRLTHAGFAEAGARDKHREAWPKVLDMLANRIASAPAVEPEWPPSDTPLKK